MTTRNQQLREDRATLQDILEDTLAIKARLSPRRGRPLLQFLLAQPLDGLHVQGIEGFRLAGNLVIFDGSDAAKVTRLIFLHPKDGKISIKRLRSWTVPKGNQSPQRRGNGKGGRPDA